MKRRIFLSSSLMAIGGAAVIGCGKKTDTASTGTAADSTVAPVTNAPAKPIGIQLYTVRDVLKDNTKVKDTIKQLVDWGYTEFETFGYSKGNLFGMTSKEFNDYVKSLGAQVVSGHYGPNVIREEWEKAVADAKDAGQSYMVLPYLEEKDRTLDGYKKTIDLVNKAAEVTKQAGIQMQYHNHAFEFDKVGDKTAFEMLMDGFDKNLVTLELDLYWTIKAGYKPEDLFAKYPGRFQQWHVKDMDKNAPDKNADVGSGSIDFKKLFALADQSGMKHWYVEHDTFAADPMTSAKNGIDYLKTI
jgi:sugar phosphate isomerase/epimerase